MILEALFAIAIDGDTLKLPTTNGKFERVRLWGIDAPETYTYEGKEAKLYLNTLVRSTPTFCHVWTRDKYGRHVGMCYIKNYNNELEDLGWKLIRSNLATDYPRYSGGYYK